MHVYFKGGKTGNKKIKGLKGLSRRISFSSSSMEEKRKTEGGWMHIMKINKEGGRSNGRLLSLSSP